MQIQPEQWLVQKIDRTSGQVIGFQHVGSDTAEAEHALSVIAAGRPGERFALKRAARIAVCSNRKRPMVQNARSYMLKTGEAAWGRDVYHLLDGNDGTTPLYRQPGAKTLCGVDCSEWLVIGPTEELTPDCCERCRGRTGQ